MQKRSKIIIAAAVAALAGAATLGSIAKAGHKHGGGQGGMHSSGMHGGKHGGHHGKWRHKHKMIKRMLKRYDANNDRALTQAEIDTNRKDWHKKYDADGDGSLSLNEFSALWLAAHRKRMVRSFQRFDVDGSAVVTLEEYLEPMAQFVENHDRNGDGMLSKKDRKHKRKGHQKQGEGGKHGE